VESRQKGREARVIIEIALCIWPTLIVLALLPYTTLAGLYIASVAMALGWLILFVVMQGFGVIVAIVALTLTVSAIIGLLLLVAFLLSEIYERPNRQPRAPEYNGRSMPPWAR
jgi:hypothetical protein